MDSEIINLELIDNTQLWSRESETHIEIVEEIKKQVGNLVFDLETKKGIDECKSVAFKISKTKTFIDNEGKEFVSKIKEQAKIIDNKRKYIRDELDALKDKVREPVTKLEHAEKQRISFIESTRLQMKTLSNYDWSDNAAAVQERIEKVSKIMLDTNIFQDEYKNVFNERNEALLKLENIKITLEANEAAAAELEKIKRENERLRQEAETQERIKQAEEKARKDAEAKAKREKEEAIEAERKKTAAAEAIRDKAAEAEKLKAKAEREKQEAIEAEAKARQADSEHRRKINIESLGDMEILLFTNETTQEMREATREILKVIISGIAKNRIRNINIQY